MTAENPNHPANPGAESDTLEVDAKTFEASVKRSQEIWADIPKNPGRYRVLTGDRPTGSLHVGHYFGSLANRVQIQNMGVTSFIIIADYQVFTDRDTADQIGSNVMELMLDYLAAGLDPTNGRTFIFTHSHVPALNQLMIPFLTLVATADLDRNPTVKEEIKAAGLRVVNGAMYTYPVHQAADILFCKANIVPVGKDQLPHLELTRKIARRFNERFSPKKPVFLQPTGLLSDVPVVLGLDGGQKMSKSRGNTITLKATADETAKAIKGAKTDSERRITYDPVKRPEVSNLVRLTALCSGRTPESIADEIGDGGSGKLKAMLTDSMNAFFAPLRARRLELAKSMDHVRELLKKGNERANEEGNRTLHETRQVMNMAYYPE